MPAAFAVIAVLITAIAASGVQVDYARDIKPLLHEKCSACHGSLKQEGDLRLDAASLIRSGGGSGSAIESGDASASLLIDRVTSEDSGERMPPEGEGEPLSPEQVRLLKAWIDSGANAPEDEEVLLDPSQHWAYQVPSHSAPPAIKDVDHPIDAWIAQRQQSIGVTPVGPADRLTLVRRVYFDLIGLPPTPKQIEDFVTDDSSDAYDNLVDRLLSDPQFGERWGRHWMDVWRYSDWSGYKDTLRGSQRHIWRWRDWIIESLNADKGYDQMIVEMLAGDEVAPDDRDVLRATGFLARNFHKSNRNIWLDATVEHTAKAFLGITINCAKCHDHKFDPIGQNEYYAMRAIFEPHHVRTERMRGQRSTRQDGLPRAFDAEPDAKTYVYLRGDEKHFDENAPVNAAIPSIFKDTLDVKPVTLPPVAVFPALWPHIEAEDMALAKQKVKVTQRSLEKQRNATPKDSKATSLAELKAKSSALNLKSLTARWSADKAKFRGDPANECDALAKSAAAAQRTHELVAAKVELADQKAALASAESSEEADPKKKKAAIAKAKKDLAEANKKLAKAEAARKNDDGQYTSVGKVYPKTSTGRRLAFAKWIANRNNPLTARVAVNHLWSRHFGEPLVSNTFDFGLRSARPVHAELLDWLATELMENDWSLKHIHRLMVTSRTYRQASSADANVATANNKLDKDNLHYWRTNVRRLDAELIRDSVLAVAESLDTAQGGADIDFALGETVTRRSVYFRHAYEKQMTMLVLFDAAGPNECYRRSESIIPQQALTLANSSLSLSQSRKLAQTIWHDVPDASNSEAMFIRQAFNRVLTRAPTESELAMCKSFLHDQASLLARPKSLSDWGGKSTATVKASTDPKMRARENLVHVLMNHNDFVTIR